MLLSFSAANYKSFREPFTFSLQPAPKQKGLDYSVLEEKCAAKTVKGLCSSVIYGPNAAGKTNIIGALAAFKAILLRGSLRNADDSQMPRTANLAAQRLELIPNSDLSAPAPVEFSLRFLTDELVFHYELRADLGGFLDRNAPRRVLFERLVINEVTVFERMEQVLRTFKPAVRLAPYFVGGASVEETRLREKIASEGLQPPELFLMNGFKTMFSPQLVEKFVDWLTKQLVVLFHADSTRFVVEPDDNVLQYFNEIIRPAAKSFGVEAHEVLFARQGSEANMATLCSEVNGQVLPADVYESYGTIRFVQMFPFLLSALRAGGTLFIDEFAASIHPMALMSLVNCFHNDEVNVKHSQLIFNTHNPIFLNADLFRRDEIKFVELENGTSHLYSLADFGTSGANGVRKGEDYLKNYFVNRYGAIRDVDFSSLFIDDLSQTAAASREVAS